MNLFLIIPCAILGLWLVSALISWAVVYTYDRMIKKERIFLEMVITVVMAMPLWYKPWTTMPEFFRMLKERRLQGCGG